MASNDTPKTILLRGDPIGGEALAAEAITPGMLLERASTGRVQRHNGGAGAKLVARELDLIGGSIDDAYAADDQVVFWTPRPGDHFYMLLAADEDITLGDLLESNGDGALQAVSTGGVPLFEALESVDNSETGDTGVARIKVEAL